MLRDELPSSSPQHDAEGGFHSGRGPEERPQTASRRTHLAHRRLHHVRLIGSTMSLRPSPIRLKQNTASMSARPGKSAIHHSPDTMKLAPSATMMPHSGVGGRTPRPMKERPAAFRMA